MTTEAQFAVPYHPVGTMYGPEEFAALTDCLSSTETLSCGNERAMFEAEFARYVGARHAIAVTNCTVALELATYLCDLREGDEVIATCQSYQATVTPLLCGPATVRFCDVEPRTLNIDVTAIEKLVTARTRAVYLVHYGGELADIGAIMDLARDRGIVVVEDCAHAIGATRHGQHPGSVGSIGCFSFQSYKNISTLGEGGMITTSNDEWAERLRRITSIEPDATYTPRQESCLGPYEAPTDGVFRHEKQAFVEDCRSVRHPGTNSTLAEPAAAVGRVQLRRLSELISRRAAIAAALDETLRDLPAVTVQTRSRYNVSAHHLYTFFLETERAIGHEDLLRALFDRGIQIQQRYFPLHLLAEWRRFGNGLGLCPAAERTWFHRQVNLPIYPQMTSEQLDYMRQSLVDTLGNL